VQLQLEERDVERLLAGIPGWAKTLEAAGIVHDLRGLAEELPLRVGVGGKQENPMQRDLPCYEGWMHAVIGPDGDVAPCCYCEGQNLGNVVEQDFADIWNGPRYVDLRRRMHAMAQTQTPICPECYTTCNRALANRQVHERLGALRIFQPQPHGNGARHAPAQVGVSRD